MRSKHRPADERRANGILLARRIRAFVDADMCTGGRVDLQQAIDLQSADAHIVISKYLGTLGKLLATIAENHFLKVKLIMQLQTHESIYIFKAMSYVLS